MMEARVTACLGVKPSSRALSLISGVKVFRNSPTIRSTIWRAEVERVTTYVSGKRNPSRSVTPLVSPGRSSLSARACRPPDPLAPEELEGLLRGQAFRDDDRVLNDLASRHPIDDLVDRHRPAEEVLGRLARRL